MIMRITPSTDAFISGGDAKVRDSSLGVVRPADKRRDKALDYHPHHFVQKALEYDENATKNIGRWKMKLRTQIRSLTFDAIEPISVVNFLCAFYLGSHTNRIHEGAHIWLFHFFMEGSCGTTLNARLFLKPASTWTTHRAKKGV